MERFFTRKLQSIAVGDDNTDERVSGDAVGNTSTDGRPSKRNAVTTRVSREAVNLDEIPYDPADRMRITDYIGHKLQDEVRQKIFD